MPEGKVVVITTPILYTSAEREAFAVRIPGMGLTGYGDTEGAAWQAFKELFSVAIKFYRERGQLEQEMNDAGVEWQWADDYDGEYEDVSGLATQTPPPAARRPQRTWTPRSSMAA